MIRCRAWKGSRQCFFILNYLTISGRLHEESITGIMGLRIRKYCLDWSSKFQWNHGHSLGSFQWLSQYCCSLTLIRQSLDRWRLIDSHTIYSKNSKSDHRSTIHGWKYGQKYGGFGWGIAQWILAICLQTQDSTYLRCMGLRCITVMQHINPVPRYACQHMGKPVINISYPPSIGLLVSIFSVIACELSHTSYSAN